MKTQRLLISRECRFKPLKDQSDTIALNLANNEFDSFTNSDRDATSNGDDERLTSSENAPSNGDDERLISSGNGNVAKWSALFVPTEPVPAYVWKPPPVDPDVDPVEDGFTCVGLLMDNYFIDKSSQLYWLLRRFYDQRNKDFRPAVLLLAYPRRFAKTTLLEFIKAVFSPQTKLDGIDSTHVKTKIAGLGKGRELLRFGLHPVLCLDLLDIESVDALNDDIDIQLKRSGLNNFVCREGTSPAQRVKKGVIMLNEKFQSETGVMTKTIILIDEYDKAFRNLERETHDPLLQALISLFTLGKKSDSGISLMVLCGLTRMVGTGLSTLNKLVDVSRQTKHHGLCGISSEELIRAAGNQLDAAAAKRYDLDFKTLLNTKFRQQWDGFRFGLDKKIGKLDPYSADGALFSPIDVWEIVQSLVEGDTKTPSPQWIETMHAEFEFTNFSKRYTSSQEGFIQLFRNLLGGWVKTSEIKKRMTRERYMNLDTDEAVKKVLFELGLLSVKEIHGDSVRLYSPNFLVSRNAMELLVAETKREEIPEDLALEYLSEEGLKNILSGAEKTITNTYAQTEEEIMREFPFQDFLYLQISCFFPKTTDENPSYKLYHETKVGTTKTSTRKSGRGDLVLVLSYAEKPETAYIFELKFMTVSTSDSNAIKLAHDKNIQKAKNQVVTYVWPSAKVTNRVAVSGVWHPSMEVGSYKLVSSIEFAPSSDYDEIILEVDTPNTE